MPNLSAAISLVGDGTNEANDFQIYQTANVGFQWATAGNFSRIYWDADTDGIFGETGIGENTGNTETSRALDIGLASGTTYEFALEGFDTGAVTDFTSSFDIRNTDTSVQRVTVTTGSATTFSDSNGDSWSVALAFNKAHYGDVVSGANTGAGGGNITDNQATLTFTSIPEPSSTALLGLGGLALILRRRK